MSNQIHSIAEGLTSAETQPFPGGHSHKSKQQFASKVLAMTGVLQTTLETNELISLFAKELSGFVNFDCIEYRLDTLQVDITLGQAARHRCYYELLVSGENLGALTLFRHHPFQQQELETIENLLSGLLYPLRNALLYYRAVQSARIDPLTGVKNRSSMDNAIIREIELAKRHGTAFSVILMDIDHFKNINDEMGHLSGDQTLRAVAQQAEKTIRNSDMLFRYGGEEFLILLSGSDLGGTERLAERLRRGIETLSPLPEQHRRVTVSLGVTCMQQYDDMQTLLKRADKALYQAKENGRNRVETI